MGRKREKRALNLSAQATETCCESFPLYAVVYCAQVPTWRGELLRPTRHNTLYSRDIEVNCMHRGWSNDASGIDSGALCKRLSSRTTHAATLRTTSPNSGAHPSGYISRLSTECISGWNYDLPAGARRSPNLPEEGQSVVSRLVVLSGNVMFLFRSQSCLPIFLPSSNNLEMVLQSR